MAKSPGRDPKVAVGPRDISVALHPDAADRLALDFCRTLARKKVEYALVSGYVAILLGRNRLSEDVEAEVERNRVDNDRFLREYSQWFGPHATRKGDRKPKP
jgi:hypothetical protein